MAAPIVVSIGFFRESATIANGQQNQRSSNKNHYPRKAKNHTDTIVNIGKLEKYF